MRALLVFLALVAVLAAGLWFAGVFDEPSAPDVILPEGGNGDVPEAGPENGNGTSELGVSTVPDERPPLEWNRFPDGTKILFIGRSPSVHNLFLIQVIGKPEQVAYQSWYLNAGGAKAEGTAKGMSPVTSMPTRDHLGENDIDVLVLDNVDPSDLPEEFWVSVDQRVRARTMGLLVQAYWPLEGIEGPMTVHPMLTHPTLSALLPVADAEPIEGRMDGTGRQRVPGVFTTARPFVVSDAGTEHPATKLVSWPEWSRAWWTSFRDGEVDEDAGFKTKFCYPVTDVRDRSRVLVGVDPGEGDPIPAIIVGAENEGRVAWFGVPELGWRLQYNPTDREKAGIVLHNLVAWLAGAL